MFWVFREECNKNIILHLRDFCLARQVLPKKKQLSPKPIFTLLHPYKKISTGHPINTVNLFECLSSAQNKMKIILSYICALKNKQYKTIINHKFRTVEPKIGWTDRDPINFD